MRPAEVNGPDAVVDLFEADGVLLQRVGQEEHALPEADGAGVERCARKS
jgi:hypothetical protein